MKLILIFEVDKTASHSQTTAEGRPWQWHCGLLIYAQVAIPAVLHSTSDITTTVKGNRRKNDAKFN